MPKIISVLFFSLTFVFISSAHADKYSELVKKMEQIAKSNSFNAEIFILGLNDQGIAIKGLKIGSGAINSLVVATHHGNEYGSTAVGLGFAEALAAKPLKDQTMYVIPVLNISGFNKNQREENVGNKLYDPNRDYTGPCQFSPTYKLKSTALLAQFLVDKNIIISATLHTFFPAVLYPWGISTRDLSTPHDAKYKELVEAATIESGYQHGNNTELLYPADGTFEDYAYWKHGIWSLLFELGFSHNPDPQAVQNMTSTNIPGLRRFFETSPKTRALDHNFSGKCDVSRMSRQRLFLE